MVGLLGIFGRPLGTMCIMAISCPLISAFVIISLSLKKLAGGERYKYTFDPFETV